MQQQRNQQQNVEIPLNNMSEQSDAHWRQVFNRYDRDGDGNISLHELREIINSREYEHDIPERVVVRIMQIADRDNSGHLNYVEFLDMIHHPVLKNVFGHLVERYVHMIIPPRRHIDSIVQAIDSIDVDTIDGPVRSWSRSWSRSTSRRSYGSPPQSPTIKGICVTPQFSQLLTQQDVDFSFLHKDGQYEDAYSCWPPPVLMIVISLIEIILFITDAVAHHTTQANGPAANVLIYNPYKRFEAWRFVTYMFVHVGWVHLTVNLLVQVLLGVPLQMVHQWWRVLVIYAAGVLAGSLGTSITDPGVFLAGASGGVYALMAAHVSTIVLNWSEMEYAFVQLLVFVLVAGVDVGTAVYNRYVLDIEGTVGYVAHLAGAMAGLLVGIGVLRNLEVKPWEKKLWWVAVLVYVLLMTAAVFINIFWTSHFPPARYEYK